MTDDHFNYERMVENALKGVVRSSLEVAAAHGLVDNHHFYITFVTSYPGVDIPGYLKEKYPEEMTIVLQYQYYNLTITDKQFSVGLSFNNIQENLVIPFAAITGFADPSVKFGLQFHNDLSDDLFDGEDPAEILELAFSDDDDPSEDSKVALKDLAKKASAPKAKGDKAENNVISLDRFRPSE